MGHHIAGNIAGRFCPSTLSHRVGRTRAVRGMSIFLPGGQLAGYQPSVDDPMDVDPDAGQVRRKQAPSTPTDAQVTDIDEADSRHPPNACKIIQYCRQGIVVACGEMADSEELCQHYRLQERHTPHQVLKLQLQIMATRP